MVLMIAYDLHKPDRDYKDVEKFIKGLSSWCHLEESVWLVDTRQSTAKIRDQLVALGTESRKRSTGSTPPIELGS
jgi:hypothetical protein